MKRGLSRRALLGGSISIGVLAACQQATPSTTETKNVEKVVTQVVGNQATVIPAPAAKPQATITFWGHENHPLDAAIPGFEAQNPNIKVKAEHLGDWLVKFKATLASGADVPDLIWLAPGDGQDLGAKGVLLDVTDVVAPNKDKFIKGKLVEVQLAKTGKYVAVPGDTALSGLWYRQDLLEKAGMKELPKDLTFDDWLTQAAEIKKETGAAAFLLPTSGWTYQYEALLSQNGGSVTSLDGTTVTIDDAKGIETMSQVKKIWDTGTTLDADWLKPPYWAAVKGGKLAADYMPSWMRGFIAGELKTATEGLGQWRCAPLPKTPNGISRTCQIGGASVVSTRFTKAPEAVKAFMQYAFITMEGAAAVGGWGIIPSYLPYLESPQFQNQKSPVFGDFLFSKVWASLANELSTTYARTGVFSEATTILTQEMMPILRGDVSVQAGVKTIGDRVREANGRYQ